MFYVNINEFIIVRILAKNQIINYFLPILLITNKHVCVGSYSTLSIFYWSLILYYYLFSIFVMVFELHHFFSKTKENLIWLLEFRDVVPPYVYWTIFLRYKIHHKEHIWYYEIVCISENKLSTDEKHQYFANVIHSTSDVTRQIVDSPPCATSYLYKLYREVCRPTPMVQPPSKTNTLVTLNYRMLTLARIK